MQDHKKNDKSLLAIQLWKWIPKKIRPPILRQMTSSELERLVQAEHVFNTLHPDSKKKLYQRLSRILDNRLPWWPVILTTALMVINIMVYALALFLYPSLNDIIKTQLLTVLLVGNLAPMMLYFLPWYKRKLLFLFPIKIEYLASAFFVYLALIWLLVEINMIRMNNLSVPAMIKILMIIGAVSAPFLEEVVFRELIPSLFGKDPFYLGQAISAILFSAAHLPDNLEMFFLYLIASGLLGILRIMTGGLLYGFIVHAFANAIVVII